jgi:hypothetical protein
LYRVDVDSLKAYTDACKKLREAPNVHPCAYKVTVPATLVVHLSSEQEVQLNVVQRTIGVTAIGTSCSINITGVGEVRPGLWEDAVPGIIDLPSKDYSSYLSSVNTQSTSGKLAAVIENYDPPELGANPPYNCTQHPYTAVGQFLEAVIAQDADLRKYMKDKMGDNPWVLNCQLSVDFDPRDIVERVRAAYGLHQA